MYSRQQAAQLRQEFWTAFGQYMAPVLSSEGERVNWVNYKTGEKNIAFRMEAGKHKNWIGMEFSHKDPGLRKTGAGKTAGVESFSCSFED